ncbi:MAG: hypothetical protein H7Y18_07895 [Clostridiaceae bacterium]|nr:hypothetical protein [Clostridiaceae bacterium]
MIDTLSYIGKKLNEREVVWGVGASMLLNHYGLINRPNDIDILVDLKDIEEADEILKSMGEKKKWEKKDTYSTKYFYEYVINGVDVDVMAGLCINHNNGMYRYIFDNSSIIEVATIKGVNIQFSALEDWYVLYQLIPNRENKVRLLENYFNLYGIKNLDLLVSALNENLPEEVKTNIKRLLNKINKEKSLILKGEEF